MINQQISGIVKTIEKLIPGAKVDMSFTKKKDFLLINGGFCKRGLSGLTGGSFSDNKLKFWLEMANDIFCTIGISRDSLPLTRVESDILGRLPDALCGLMIMPSRKNLVATQNISSYLSFEHLLVSKFLRRGHSPNYWTQALILILLQELTFERYEGNKCTSGFVFTSQPQLYLDALKNQDDYEFVPFEKKIQLTECHFEKPASFRYVDGKNSFYLIDNMQFMHGILRNKVPKKYSIVDRCAHEHLIPITQQMPGRVWMAYIGNNDDVNVHGSNNMHLRWCKNHWQMRDKIILKSLLTNHSCEQNFVEKLCAVIYTLSDMRNGSLILLPEEDFCLPEIQGKIDNSEIGKALIKSTIHKSFVDLIDSHSVLGVLSSDGLTTITKQGKVIGCGDIINLSIQSKTDKTCQVSGGGRSQAAAIASHYGLCIKISEDGPITIYYKGKELIRI